jgi:hypothetical protein
MTIIPNKLWYGIDYREYDKPTIIRRHGFNALKKFWHPRQVRACEVRQ